jgi:hypothetical protein
MPSTGDSNSGAPIALPQDATVLEITVGVEGALITLNSVPQQASNVLSRVIEGEAMLVDLGHNKVRVLNPVGARLWELADGDRSVGEIADVIVAEYDVELAHAQADAITFYRDLASREVLVFRETD